MVRALDSGSWIFILGALVFIGWKASTWKANIEHRLSSVEKTMETFSGKLDEVYIAIIGRFGRAVEKSTSPVTLTEYGVELAGKIDAQKVVDAYADKLHRETENMNAYKVQEYCFSFCKEKLPDDLEQNDKTYFDKISNVAYEEGINIEKLTRVLGIKLRDKVLSMKGKSHAEIDEHSPTEIK